VHDMISVHVGCQTEQYLIYLQAIANFFPFEKITKLHEKKVGKSTGSRFNNFIVERIQMNNLPTKKWTIPLIRFEPFPKVISEKCPSVAT